MFNTGENRYFSILWANKKGDSSMRLFVLLSVFSAVRGLQVTIPLREYEVKRGDDVTLPCRFQPAKPDNLLVIVTWTMEADKPEEPKIVIASYYSNTGQLDIKPSYKGRVEMINDIPGGQSTLTIRQATMLENRLWQCRVQIPGDDEGVLSATTELVVLVPPSVPVVRVQGEAEYWANINLTCVSEEGSPTPTYKWSSYGVRNTNRPFPPRTTEKEGVLSLFNISMETSGFFICTATNKISSSSFNYTLTVMPASMKMGSTLAIIGGVLAGLLVLGIVIFCCRKKRNKDKQKAFRGAPETEYQDNALLKVGAGYQDVASERRAEGSLGLPDEHAMRVNVDHDDRSVRTERSDGRQEKSNENLNNCVDQRDRNGGSRDRLDDERDRHGGSRDRLDDQRNRHSGSRDRLDDQRDRYGGSRDRLDDPPVVSYSRSRERLDDLPVDRYHGSRDRLDQRNKYGGSRDRLDDPPVVRYSGSRDRLDDPPVVRYSGSRERLDDQRNRYGGSRDRLDDALPLRHGGSQDRLDDYR